MNTITKLLIVLGMAAVLCQSATAAAPAPADPLTKPPSWQPPRAEEVKAQAIEWLQQTKADEKARAKAADLWSKLPGQPSGAELLACLAETFALGDPRAAALRDLCAKPRSQLSPPGQPWLSDPKTPPLLARNLRVLYGRWLAQGMLYDEAKEQLADLKPAEVAAPAELLFYQGVVHHRLLNKEPGLKAINDLLDGEAASPRRFVVLARLMEVDLSGLKDDTLDHIARRMEGIGWRLNLGRAGPKVRELEDGVIKSLDKLIKKIEDEQQKQQQQASSGSKGQRRSTSPAPDSRIMGGSGPGNVVKRNLGSKGGWGDLPPKEREEALQQIGRDFPSHFRDVIEQYFRRQASEEDNEDK